MMRKRTYEIEVKDSIFNPREASDTEDLVAHYKRAPSRNDKTHYKVYLYLEGKDLPFIRRVKYVLHRTFRNNVKIIERTTINPNCMLVLWTWGIFTVKVEIEDINGNVISIDHYLTYGDEINKEGVEWTKK